MPTVSLIHNLGGYVEQKGNPMFFSYVFPEDNEPDFEQMSKCLFMLMQRLDLENF